MKLSAVNSINWARIAAQIPYYVAAALALGAPDREVAFSVPTGNFGNVLAAWAARRMGLPVARLIVGSNRNDILARFLAANDMSIARGGASAVAQHGHPGQLQLRAAAVRAAGPRRRRDRRGHGGLSRGRPNAGARCRLAPLPHRVPWVPPGRCRHRAEIARLHAVAGYLADPHTAIGIAAAQANPPGHGVTMIAMATAHPAKFPDAIERATGAPPCSAAAACRSVRPGGALHRAAERPCGNRGAGARAGTAQRMRILDAAQTAAALPFARLIPALREAFVSGAKAPLRHRHDMAQPDGTNAALLLMPAWRTGGFLGVKVVSVFPGNGARGRPAVASSYVLCDGETGQHLALIDGGELTGRRTAAASALAASFLARTDSTSLLVVGSGHIAGLLPAAYRAVRSMRA